MDILVFVFVSSRYGITFFYCRCCFFAGADRFRGFSTAGRFGRFSCSGRFGRFSTADLLWRLFALFTDIFCLFLLLAGCRNHSFWSTFIRCAAGIVPPGCFFMIRLLLCTTAHRTFSVMPGGFPLIITGRDRCNRLAGFIMNCSMITVIGATGTTIFFCRGPLTRGCLVTGIRCGRFLVLAQVFLAVQTLSCTLPFMVQLAKQIRTLGWLGFGVFRLICSFRSFRSFRSSGYFRFFFMLVEIRQGFRLLAGYFAQPVHQRLLADSRYPFQACLPCNFL